MTWGHPNLQSLCVFFTIIDHLNIGVAKLTQKYVDRRRLWNWEKRQPVADHTLIHYALRAAHATREVFNRPEAHCTRIDQMSVWRCLTLSPNFHAQLMCKLQANLDKSHGPSAADFKALDLDVYFVYLLCIWKETDIAGFNDKEHNPRCTVCASHSPSRKMYCASSKLTMNSKACQRIDLKPFNSQNPSDT